jgi:acyl carrier protein
MSLATPESVLDFLRRVCEKEFELAAERVRPASHLVRDLDLDSVDAMVLALRLEEETGLELTDDELASLDTVASVVALVQRRLAERKSRAS